MQNTERNQNIIALTDAINCNPGNETEVTVAQVEEFVGSETPNDAISEMISDTKFNADTAVTALDVLGANKEAA